jgi:hypothetical protein
MPPCMATIGTLQALLKQKAGVNAAQAYRATAIHGAYLEIADLLIAAAANVKAAKEGGLTPSGWPLRAVMLR